jgi:hypothetical protein
MRVKGSCKFSTYYRLQAWNPSLLTWKPVGAFPSVEKAGAAVKASGQYRLWEISMDADPVIVENF